MLDITDPVFQEIELCHDMKLGDIGFEIQVALQLIRLTGLRIVAHDRTEVEPGTEGIAVIWRKTV